ncbi:MAG TPA: GMC family oxidoreductase N-terminal domain-containing protein [Polyangiales bacterium]|nr:GMC family oxidoreductase N-terminal domain-containing protein [Polyangiales bacterium]
MEQFDYVIVGAGAAGCLLAERLSADGKNTVALIEAGGSDRHPNVMIPAAFAKLFGSDRDWAYYTEPQPGLNQRRLFWPRGKMLGGSSSINAQMYVRGHRRDYEGWADALGWSYADIRAAFAGFERYLDGGPEFGRDGAQVIEKQRDPNPTTFAFLEACNELGIRTIADVGEFENEGVQLTSVTQKRGLRFSAADAFLRPALGRKNLSVLKKLRTDRIELDGTRALGVQSTGDDGRVQTIRARREVVLCAGAIGTPQLLLLSGVGPAADLRTHGISVVRDAPEVGRNLQDHTLTGVIHHCPQPVTLFLAESLKNLALFVGARRGMLTSNVGEAAAFVRSDPSLDAPDLELIYAPVPYIDHGTVKPTGHGISIAVILLTPESRGSVSLLSRDPSAPPRIDPNYQSDARDLARIAWGVRLAEKLFHTRALTPFTGDLLEGVPAEAPDVELEAYIREQTETLYHPVGTCRAGSDEASVVDPSLCVRGLQGLRIADASVMPTINRGHTYAPTLMLAERAAAMIRA